MNETMQPGTENDPVEPDEESLPPKPPVPETEEDDRVPGEEPVPEGDILSPAEADADDEVDNKENDTPDSVAPPYETPNIPGAEPGSEEPAPDSPPVPAPDTSPPDGEE